MIEVKNRDLSVTMLCERSGVVTNLQVVDDDSGTYVWRCPTCEGLVITNYDGSEPPGIECRPGEHTVYWPKGYRK